MPISAPADDVFLRFSDQDFTRTSASFQFFELGSKFLGMLIWENDALLFGKVAIADF
jgi:hypothetical protein